MDNEKFISEFSIDVGSDGLLLRLGMKTEDGKQQAFLAETEMIQNFAAQLLTATQAAANNMSSEELAKRFPKDGDTITIQPIDVARANAIKGRSPEEVVLDLNIGCIRLSFAVSKIDAMLLVKQIYLNLK